LPSRQGETTISQFLQLVLEWSFPKKNELATLEIELGVVLRNNSLSRNNDKFSFFLSYLIK
jgi:hypothetical protein